MKPLPYKENYPSKAFIEKYRQEGSSPILKIGLYCTPYEEPNKYRLHFADKYPYKRIMFNQDLSISNEFAWAKLQTMGDQTFIMLAEGPADREFVLYLGKDI